MKIELLFVPDCPHVAPTLARLREVLSREGLTTPVEQVEVRDASSAAAYRFPGSPTVRINGRDIAPDAHAPFAPSLACRLYSAGPGAGIPPSAAIHRAVLAALDEEAS